MSDYYILDENNNAVPIGFDALIEWSKIRKDRHVGDDTINGYRISTVFLTINHNHWGVGRPLLFETMIFDSNGKDAFDYQERCSTWQEAERQHKEAIEFVRKQKEIQP